MHKTAKRKTESVFCNRKLHTPAERQLKISIS